jgi:hypothetical protein
MASQPSPFDPLPRLEPGEDRFVIREKDPVGPQSLTGWSAARRLWAFKRYGTNPAKGTEERRLLDAELAQCAEAEEKALAWRERQTDGAPADEQRATYADAVQSESQIAAVKRQKLQADLERNLAEADYCAAELLAIDGPDATPEQAENAAAIHALALAVRFGAREAV